MGKSDRRSEKLVTTVDELTERDLEQLSDEELAALEEPEYDPEALREVLRLKPGGGSPS